MNENIQYIETSVEVLNKQINHLNLKIVFDYDECFIDEEENETEIKTPDSQKFVNIYHTLKSLGIDNETQILEYRAAYENIIEDLDNDITDLKEMNKNFNKEKYQLEKIRETVMDMKMKKYILIISIFC